MKSIKKLKSTGKAVAGSALLVGATLTGAAGLAAAQDSGSMDLGDYPQPFINEDGEVDSTIVVGEQANTADVVGAINVAGSLGNAAFMEEEVEVDVSGAVASWTAENGVTLNRDNDNLFLNDMIDAQENDFDEDDLDVLQTTTVRSEDGEEVELEFEAEVGNQDQEFSDVGDYDDPILHVTNPSSPEVNGDYLLQSTVEFSDTMDFSETETDNADDNADEVLEDGDELELFGTVFTFSEESTSDELVLYGSSESFEVNTGEETTTTVEGEEHTFAAEYVTDDASEATITVDGDTESVTEGDTVTVSNQDVRITNIFRTGPDGQGRVQFSIGSEEVTITENDVEVDGDTVDGVDVSVEGNANEGGAGPFAAADSITFAFGAQDSDENFVEVGEAYEDPVFGALEFHYGGPNPDAAEDPAETFEVEADEDGEAQVSFMAEGGDEVTQTIADVDAGATSLMADSDEDIATVEGEELEEDDYVVLNQNEDSGMYQVTSIDTSLTSSDLNDGDGSVSLTLQNVASGNSVDVEEENLDDGDADPNVFTLESESVDGMDHDITFDSSGSEDTVSLMGSDETDGKAVFPAIYTQEDGAVAFSESTTIDGTNVADLAQSEIASSNKTVEANSEMLFDFDNLQDEDVTVDFIQSGGGSQFQTTVTVDSNGDAQVNVSNSQFTYDQVEVNPTNTDAGSVNNLNHYFNYSGSGQYTDSASYDGSQTFTSFSSSGDGGTTFNVRLPSTTSSNEYEVTFDDSDDGSTVGTRPLKLEVTNVDTSADTATVEPAGVADGADAAVHYIQPENDNDVEDAYVADVDVSDNAGNGLIDVTYTGMGDRAELEGQLDDDRVFVGYNTYGTYVENDEEDDSSESLTLNVPGAQATSGLAVTGMDGSISAEGGGSGSATTMTPTGWPDAAALDSEVSGSDRDQDMILVGGPAVNTLTEELAQDDKTWTADEYEEDTWVLDLVEGFSEDTHALVVAGYAADDTQAASNFISNYADNADELAGETRVSMTTAASQ